MKKVLVLAAAFALFATPALATIVGSAHDLSGDSADTDQLCVYCHTPHGGATDAPLWNRSTGGLGSVTAYTSTSLNATLDYTVGDVKLCMTCHDGDVTDSLTNLGGAASGALANTSGGLTFTSVAQLGTDFTNDHPVGFDYRDVEPGGANADGELVDITATSTAVSGTVAVNSLLFNGTGSRRDVWCSSCHDVHNPGAGSSVPFLRVSNTSSALCLSCHAK